MGRKPNYGQNRADVNRAKQARKEIEAQDNEIAKASGKSALPIASLERVGGKKR